MANNFELKFDKLIIKSMTQELQKEFQQFSKKELTDALAVYDNNLSSGKNVDGGGMKAYSKGYIEAMKRSDSAREEHQKDVKWTRKERRRNRDIPMPEAPKSIFQTRKGRAIHKKPNPVNLLITGDLRRSRKVRKAEGEKIGAEIIFSGDHYSGQSTAALAKHLHKRGFLGWHQYSKKDMIEIPKKALVLLDEIVKKGITIIRKT